MGSAAIRIPERVSAQLALVFPSAAPQIFVHEGARLQATMSCGLASCPGDGTDADTLLRGADRALYAAKEGGRNQLRAAGVVA